MATAARLVYSHITKRPGVRGGTACHAGEIEAELAEEEGWAERHERRRAEALAEHHGR
jgi:hypothetical protein